MLYSEALQAAREAVRLSGQIHQRGDTPHEIASIDTNLALAELSKAVLYLVENSAADSK